jgi:hypothetical protein
MTPKSLREWIAVAAIHVLLLALFALVARGPAYRSVLAFWYPWTCLICVLSLYFVRRAYLLRAGRADEYTWVDKWLLGVGRMLALVAMGVLLVRV